MTTIINPYLSFTGKCSEAMSFYKECLGGDLSMQIVGESPMAHEWPESMQQHVLHATLSKDDTILLVASDMGVPGQQEGSHSISISLTCGNADELRNAFSSLSAGGDATRPVHEFFGGMIGTLVDKYNISWILYCAK